ncbi:LPXTG cell wall anchor domain-containing protein [Bifidobacterium sp. ESL0769]|uniref:LPXTG cell wall anchor domain-containing protein n=1 Tax=Bifidobacterium sp. ESL0769 TaxID=2983229 RepID=UPI0023F7167F|nr:LPXTG cell wall anchor domain-containing protein [Bifidobacterium sp. ESL0769]WEV67352.1 LPXTG cell wall anchor domain-containing protein [Bifidobacterium sp. ESL0769]
MAKKQYTLVASFAAACMMFAGVGVGVANAGETPSAPGAPAAAQSAQTATDASSTSAQQSSAAKSARAAEPKASEQQQTSTVGSQSVQAQADEPSTQASQSVKDGATPKSAPTPNVQGVEPRIGGGVSCADSVKITNVKVSDIGAHTANVSFDYQYMNGGACEGGLPLHEPSQPADGEHPATTPMLQFSHITSIVPKWNKGSSFVDGWNFGFFPPDIEGGVNDTDLTSSSYQQVYGVHADEPYYDAVGNSGSEVTSLVSGVGYYRWGDNSMYKTEDHVNIALMGLQPNTHYENKNVNANGKDLSLAPASQMVAEHATELANQGKLNQRVNTDITQMVVGVNCGPAGMSGSGAALIPAFTTKAEPTAPASGDLNNGNQGSLVTPSNPVAGSPSRIYINNLGQGCKASVDGKDTPSCFWSGYIYSNPTQLTDPSGAPYLEVKKDASGYYVEPLLPAEKTGLHKIALFDENGNLAGWTAVNIAAKSQASGGQQGAQNANQNQNNQKQQSGNGGKLPETGASVAMVLIAAVVALVAAAGIVALRRRRA